MANRRQFIQSGIAVTAVSLAAGESARAAASDPAVLELERFVFDNRFPEAVAAGRAAAARGVRPAETSGDVTWIWYDDFDLKWRQAPMALGGITTRHGLFVLETLAADRGMRVVYRGEHGPAAGGRIRHAVSGPAAIVAKIAGVTGASAWDVPVALAMLECPVGEPVPARVEFDGVAGRQAERDDALISWIIAPRSRVALIV